MSARDDYEERAPQRLTEQFRGKARIAAFAASISAEAQALELAVLTVLVADALSGAAGVELDVLGQMVGEARAGRADDTYRAWIGARINANRSDGLEEDLIGVVRAVVPAGVQIRIEPEYPAALTIHAIGPVDVETGVALGKILQEAKSGGVRLLFHWTPAAAGTSLRFSAGGWTGSEVISARGFGAGELTAVSDGRSMAW